MLRSNTLLPATFDDGLRYVYHRFRSLQLLIYTLLDNTLSEDERIRSPRYRLVAWFYHYASSCLDAHTGQSSGKFATGITRQNITTKLAFILSSSQLINDNQSSFYFPYFSGCVRITGLWETWCPYWSGTTLSSSHCEPVLGGSSWSVKQPFKGVLRKSIGELYFDGI